MVRTILNEKVAQVYDNSPNGKPLGVWYTVKQNMLDYAAQQGVDICQLQRDLEAEYGIHEPYSVQARGEAHASEDILLQFTRKQLDFLAKALVAMAVVP